MLGESASLLAKLLRCEEGRMVRRGMKRAELLGLTWNQKNKAI